jgi:hypothetical protein
MPMSMIQINYELSIKSSPTSSTPASRLHYQTHPFQQSDEE